MSDHPAPSSPPEAEGADLKARMRALAAHYAAELPALDTHTLIEGELLRREGVKLSFMPMGERDGAYDPENKVILINSQSSPARQRFTLAHEISHALLLSDDDLLSDLHDAYEGEKLEQVIETLCNVGASAILIGRPLLLGMLARFGPSGRALAELVRRADVSASAALYALIEAADEQPSQPREGAPSEAQLIFVVCAPSGRGEARQLSVRVSGATAAVKYPLRPGTPVPDEHPIQIAYETGLPLSVKSYVPFRSGRKMPAFVDVYPEGRRIFASFNLDPASVLPTPPAPGEGAAAALQGGESEGA